MHTIIKESGYLHVTLEGMATYQAFKDAIEEELARDDYLHMNDIWQFDNCILSVAHNQFHNIVSDIFQLYPQQATRTKTAIVTSSGVSRALVLFWTEIAESLPYEIQSFMSLDEAKVWIA